MNNQPAKTATPSKEEKVRATLILIGFLFIGVVFFIVMCSDDNDTVAGKKSYTKVEALTASHQFIEDRLKSPSTAQWCYGDDQVSQINDSTFFINSCVDSQNGFGAMIRTRYRCNIIFRSNNMVNCTDILME
jgi:hypothetical protein